MNSLDGRLLMKIIFEDLTYEYKVRLFGEVDVLSVTGMKLYIFAAGVVEFKENSHNFVENGFAYNIYHKDYNNRLACVVNYKGPTGEFNLHTQPSETDFSSF
jgi:hypothetical protein